MARRKYAIDIARLGKPDSMGFPVDPLPIEETITSMIDSSWFMDEEHNTTPVSAFLDRQYRRVRRAAMDHHVSLLDHKYVGATGSVTVDDNQMAEELRKIGPHVGDFIVNSEQYDSLPDCYQFLIRIYQVMIRMKGDLIDMELTPVIEHGLGMNVFSRTGKPETDLAIVIVWYGPSTDTTEQNGVVYGIKDGMVSRLGATSFGALYCWKKGTSGEVGPFTETRSHLLGEVICDCFAMLKLKCIIDAK